MKRQSVKEILVQFLKSDTFRFTTAEGNPTLYMYLPVMIVNVHVASCMPSPGPIYSFRCSLGLQCRAAWAQGYVNVQ